MKKFYLFMVMLFAAIAANAVTLTADIYQHDGTDYVKAAEQSQVEATIDGATVTFANYLGSELSFSATCNSNGTVTDNRSAGTVDGSFTFGEFGEYSNVYFYGTTEDAEYAVSEDGVQTLTVWLCAGYVEGESDGTWFKIIYTLPDDFEAESYAKTTAKITFGEASASLEIEYIYEGDGVITFPNLFGSGVDATFTIATNAVSNNISGNYYSVSLGEIGEVSIYLGNNSYVQQTYSTKGSSQTLKLVVWESNDDTNTVNISITLPENFEAQRPVYYGTPYSAVVTITDNKGNYFKSQKVDATLYFDGNDIVIPNFLNGGKTVTYTLADDGTITGGVQDGYTTIDFTAVSEAGDSISFESAYGYGNKATFDTATRRLKDRFYGYIKGTNYTSSEYLIFAVTIPKLTEATATVGEESATFKVPYTYDSEEQGVITFPDIFGTTVDATFTITEDGTISNNVKGNYYDCVLGGLNETSIYLSNDSYTKQSYAEAEDGTKTITLSVYSGTASNSRRTIVITLPETFELKVLEKNANAYAIVDGVQSEEAIPFHLETSISGSVVTISNPFGTSGFSFPFTMQTDGSIACTYNVGGYYTKNCTFNGKSYVRFFEDSRVYDLESKTFIWTIGFTDDSSVKDFASSEQFVVYLPLPEDFEPSVPQVLEKYATRVVNVEHNIEKQVASSTTTVEISNIENRQITLTKIFDKTVSISVAWDENGKVTVDDTFPSQYYLVNRDYYTTIAIDAENSKYVKNDEDEYIEFAMSITNASYGSSDYPSALCRLYFVKNSADPQTITTYYYEYTDDEDGDEYTFSHVYTLDNTRITLKNFLDSPKDLTLRFHEIYEGEDYGVVDADWEEGEVVSGPFYAFGEEYETLTFDEAGWYVSRGSNYGYIDFAFGEKNVELYFSLPKSLMFDEAVSSVANIAVESAEGNVEYFNLQGVRVANPANGIFIRRAGNSVQKVLVK
jgi:hypothetical protein